MENILTIDVGTMSIRAIIYNIEGKSLFTSSFEYHTIIWPEGLVEQDTKDWAEGLAKIMTETGAYVKEKKLTLEAVSVTSQRASVIPIAKDGTPLYNAVTWQDKRSVAICDQLIDAMSLQSIYRKTGLRANPYFSLPKMMWFKQNRIDIYKQAYKLIGVQDYIIYLLTGTFKTDWTQAARTMLMNIKSFEWSKEMLSVSGIDKNKLCELCPPSSAAGGLTAEYAKKTGLPEGLPVLMAGGDQQNAALALNVLKTGKAEANTGTGSFVIVHSDKVAFDKKCRVLCSASAVPGKWISEAGIFNSGAIYRWFKEQFYQGKGVTFETINKEVEASEVGAGGVTLLPHFEGSAAPNWNPLAKGMFFNLSLGTKRGDLARAIIEGIAMEIADNISLIEDMIGDLEQISVAGGMTKSPLFNQIQADVSYRPVVKYANSEATSLGAAMTASVSLGIYKSYEEAFKKFIGTEDTVFMPDPANHIRYMQIRERRRELYDAIKGRGVYEKFMRSIV
jgi:glycerol kinase